MTNRNNTSKQRNTLLTVALVAVIIHGLIMAAVYWTVLPEAQRGLQNIGVWLMFLTAVADVVAGVALWLWKRWGIYLYAASSAVSAVVIVLFTGDIFLLLGALLPAIIVLYIVMVQRHLFD